MPLVRFWHLCCACAAMFLAWRFGKPLGSALFPDLADHWQLVAWLVGGFFAALPLLWLKERIALKLEAGAGGAAIWHCCVALLAAWLGWRYGQTVGSHWFPFVTYGDWSRVAGGLCVAFAVVAFGDCIAWLTWRDLFGDTSPQVRRSVGLLWTLVSAAIPLGLLYLVLHAARFKIGDALLIAAAILIIFNKPVMFHVKHSLGLVIAPLRRMRRFHRMFYIGSGHIAGLFQHWVLPWKRGAILFGKCSYWPSWWVGIKDERHLLTIASNGGWKGRSVIIPNLLSWVLSALVIDIKGTLSLVTSKARAKLGPVYCLNPSGVNDGIDGMPPSVRFNPLSHLDPNSPDYYEKLYSVADALVVPSSSDPIWDDSSRTLYVGLAALAKHKYADKATLMDVRELLNDIADPKSPVIAEMQNAGGLMTDAVAQISAADDRFRSNIIASALQHTDWLGSKAMQHTLSASDFKLSDLKDGIATVYVVVAPHEMETHKRFMRLFINLTIDAASTGGRSKNQLLFLLDEFYALGAMPSLARAVGVLRSYNIRLWPILQNLSQLIELYPKNHQGFISSAGQIQVFAINDEVTAKFVSDRMGSSGSKVDLRDRIEVTIESSRISGRQIVLREGEDPLVLERMDYLHDFPRSAYNQDVDYQ